MAGKEANNERSGGANNKRGLIPCHVTRHYITGGGVLNTPLPLNSHLPIAGKELSDRNLKHERPRSGACHSMAVSTPNTKTNR